MAADETNNPSSAPSLEFHDHYPEMITAAIEALDGKTDRSAISYYIEMNYTDLPNSHSTLLSHHLDVMKENGQLTLVDSNYVKADLTAPAKRGRGRPPKAKVASSPAVAAVMAGPPRPRGRPPKQRDPFAPVSQPKKTSSGSGRPRGRPPKKVKSAAAAPASVPATDSGTRRGRGRPPKVKPALAAVGC